MKTLLYCAFFGSLASAPLLANPFYWTGLGGNGSWSDEANWSDPAPDFSASNAVQGEYIFLFNSPVEMQQSMGTSQRRFDRFEFSTGSFQLSNGTGALTFVKGTGGIVVSGGHHSISAGSFNMNVFASTSSGGLKVNDGSLTLTTSGSFAVAGSSALRYLPVDGNGTITLNGILSTNSNGGTLKLRESFSGKLILNTAGSTIGVGELLHEGSGTVRLDADDALGTLAIHFNNAAAKIESGLGARKITNAVLAETGFSLIGGYDLELAGAMGNSGALGQTVNVKEAGTTLHLSGSVSGSSGQWTKEGAGTVVLSADNAASWSQAIVVEEGVLRVENAAGSATGSGAVTISADGSLAGNGRIGGVTSIHGTLELGETAALRFGDHLTLEDESRIVLSYGSGPALLEGDLSVGEQVTLVLDASSSWEVGQTYRLFELTDGTITGSLTLAGPYTALWDIQSGPDGYIAFELQAIPEPGHWALLLSGAALLGWKHRRALSQHA